MQHKVHLPDETLLVHREQSGFWKVLGKKQVEIFSWDGAVQCRSWVEALRDKDECPSAVGRQSRQRPKCDNQH